MRRALAGSRARPPTRGHAALGVLAAGATLACGAPSEPRPVARSSSIVLAPAEDRLFVASPDDDAVVVIATADGSELSRTAVAGAPEELAWAGASLVATLGRASAVAVLDDAGALLGTIDVPCGSTRSVTSLDGRTFVSCPDDDRVVELDVEARSVVATRAVAGGPAGIALFGDRLGVALWRRGVLATFDLGGDAALTDASSSETTLATDARATSQAASLTADPVGGFVTLFLSVENDGDRDRDPARGGYGAVVDGSPRIEPRLRSACGDRYARFDGGARAMSGPSAVATGGGLLWIANLYTDNVLLARCAPASDEARSGGLDVVTTFGVGRAPRGIALGDGGRTAYVDAGFDWAVSRLDAPAAPSPTARLTPTWTRRRTLGSTTLSPAALAGRSLFFDAVDTHLTPSGVVTCGTCHPRGGDDGLSWFLHTTGVPRKLRRTPPAWTARPAFSPFHWDGEFTNVAVLARTTTEELMEGDGLLIDFGRIAAYLAELPPPAARPVASAEEAAAIERGRAFFTSAGCDTCHVGGTGVDGLAHEVLPPAADPDGVLAMVDTPPLVAVRTRAPHFHDGRAPTLADTLIIPFDLHGRTSTLTPDERMDLVTYLESL